MKAASLPLIGVTAGHSLSPTNLPLLSAPQAYLTALRQAGALPVLLPLELEPPALDALLDQLDGLLLSGGGDIHPRRYGGPLHPAVNSVDEARDASELYLAQAATQRGVPLLGICRGLQTLNVALGGSLYEDLSDQRPGSQRHAFDGEFPRDYEAHPVQIEPGSRLAKILGQTSLPVNSLHHQGIRDLAPGLAATAHAPDGVIEAVEIPSPAFALAVQWHPEWLLSSLAMRALFARFVSAAGEGRI